jgi:hypothetical protein
MNVPRMDSHGGWVGSPTELVNFAMAVDGSANPPDVINTASVNLMRRPTKVYAGYGRGWGISPRDRNRAHTGLLPGTTTLLALNPGGIAFAAFTNTRDDTSFEDLVALGWKMRDVIVG